MSLFNRKISKKTRNPLAVSGFLAVLTAGVFVIGCNRADRNQTNAPVPTNVSNPAPTTDTSVSGTTTSATSSDTTVVEPTSPVAAEPVNSSASTASSSSTTETSATTPAKTHHKISSKFASGKKALRKTAHYQKKSRRHLAQISPHMSRSKTSHSAAARTLTPNTTPDTDKTIDRSPTLGSESGTTTSANAGMGTQKTMSTNETGLMMAPGRFASALTDWGVDVKINDAAAANPNR